MRRGTQWLAQGAEVLAAQAEIDEDALVQRRSRRRGQADVREGETPIGTAQAGAGPREARSRTVRDQDWQELAEPIDVVVVGSGYGGAVAASHAARHGRGRDGDGNERPLSVLVLERGLEYLPGDFPKTLDEMVPHVRFSGGRQPGVSGLRDGLFDVRLGDDVNALVANGLGGGSLINAGVAEEADEATLADAAWPAPWRGNTVLWNELYGRARKGLQALRWDAAPPGKASAMRNLARSLHAADGARAVCLTIQPSHGQVSPASSTEPPLNPCALCGDCFSGCNEGAKRTLSTSYLKDAYLAGAQLYTGATVLAVERGKAGEEDVWLVRWVFTDPKRLPGRKEPFTLRARRVVLAAGTFGSTEVLLRSQRPGLRFSSQLGAGFSANADMIGAQYGLPHDVNPSADETVARAQRRVGPTITRRIDIGRRAADPARRLVVQDLTVPAPLAWFYGELLTGLMLPQRWSRFDLAWRSRRGADRASVDDAALKRSLLVTAFSHDGAAGRLRALPGFDTCGHDGNLVVHWPKAGQAPCYATHYEALRRATPRPAYWLNNPLWKATPESPLLDPPRIRQIVTVHPLGGCRMADSSADGVVDAFGRVFDVGSWSEGVTAGRKGAAWVAREDRRVHEGLYVLDGSIMPTSLGINPLLTITALAEGIVREWVDDWNAQLLRRPGCGSYPGRSRLLPAWPAPVPTPQAWPTAGTPRATTLRFRERMSGRLHPAFQPSAHASAPTQTRHGATEHGACLAEDGIRQRLRLDVTFDFESIVDVQRFVRGREKKLRFEAKVELAASNWNERLGRQEDRPPTAAERLPHGAAEQVRAHGEVVWFEQATAGPLARAWRALRGWWRMRKAADLPAVDAHGRRLPSLWGTPSRWGPTLGRAWHFAKALTHFGAPRLLAYQLRLQPGGNHLYIRADDGTTFCLAAGTRLYGSKRLVYEPGANPWVQLTEMDLRWDAPRGTVTVARLYYDELFMLGRDTLPLVVQRQHDGATGLRDMASLALYFARVVFEQHFLSFRKPDYALPRPLRRLPQAWSRDEQQRFDGLELTPYIPVVVGEPRSDGTPMHGLLPKGKAAVARQQAAQARLPPFPKDSVAATPTTPALPASSARNGKPGGIRLRLARVKPKGFVDQDPPRTPLLLLHGLGSAGMQFLHPSISNPIAQSLAEAGHDVWVGELRTSIGLPTHQQQWVMDDIAREDIPALVDEVLARTGAAQLDVVAHCIGSAMFCMAVLDGKLMRDGEVVDPCSESLPVPSKIRRAVLLQVGPVVHLPRGNRMRGYVGNRLQKLLGLAMAESTIDDDASDGDVSVDRVLGTFPFLAGRQGDPWHGREREAGVRLTGDLRRNGELTNAFRSAGVFAQLFQWRNLADHAPTLAALPDLLGGCNLTTYQQTVQYTFLRRLSNQDGSSAYVTDDNLRRHMHFPIRFLQGALNDVFAPRGTHESVQLLRRVNGRAQVVDRKLIEGHGHLDVVVGTRVGEKVLPLITGFLGDSLPAQRPSAMQDRPGFRAPSVGPWIGDARPPAEDGSLSLRIGLRLDEQRTASEYVATLLVVDGRERPETLLLHDLMPSGVRHHWPAPQVAAVVPAVAFRDDGETVLDVTVAAGHRDAERIEILVASPDLVFAPVGLRGAMQAQWPDRFLDEWREARLKRLQHPPRSGTDIPIDSVILGRHWLDGQRCRDSVSFVLAACRQAPLLTDRERADASMAALCSRASIDTHPPTADAAFAQPAAERPPHHVLLVGDQIYADALAASGGVDGTRQRFFEAYREAWSADAQRAAMRRVPFYMAADDHEFRDNHSLATRQRHPDEWAAASMAMWRYQFAAGPVARTVLAARGEAARSDAGHRQWYAFAPCGFPTFVCDTRNERDDGRRVDRSDAAIMSPRQFDALAAWLSRSKQTGRPRFLVLPTPVAPFFRSTHPYVPYGLRCDDWQRYPQSLERLFGLLVADGAERLCLLGGDYHCYADCTVSVARRSADAPPVTFRSVTTSGLYCPYEFANTDREELWEAVAGERLLLERFHWSYTLDRFATGSGYTRIDAGKDDTARDLRIAWIGTDRDASDPSPTRRPYPANA